MRTRAERRHHHDRMLKKAENSFWCKAIKQFVTEDEYHIRIAKLSETRAPCSCHMCGNPRKYFNTKTLQEIRFLDIDERDDDS